MSLEFLLSPISREVFFRDFWERQVLHVSRNDPEHFGPLAESLSLDEIIWQTCHTWGEVSLARANTDYRAVIDTAQPPTLPTISKAFADEYTVVVNSLERRSLRLAQLCREIEKECLFATSVNLYATAPNSQGLDYHYDDQDVFILQMQGEKTWRIYDASASLPLDDVAYEHIACETSGYREFLLRVGDVLYVPRGIVHDARTNDCISVHLTLSVSVVRWVSLLQHLMHILAQHDIELRKAIPLEILRTGQISSSGPAPSLVRQLFADPHFGTAISELQDRLLGKKSRLPSSQTFVTHIDNRIGLETRVGIAADQVWVLCESQNSLVLKCIGASIEVSADIAESLTFVCGKGTFLVRDLPGGLSDEQKLGLVKRLVECGFLMIQR